MTDIARKELRSYKQLPQIWYGIQSNFVTSPGQIRTAARAAIRDEDSYSFDIDAAG